MLGFLFVSLRSQPSEGSPKHTPIWGTGQLGPNYEELAVSGGGG